MTAFVSPNDATIQATTHEAFLLGCLWKLQDYEANATTNPTLENRLSSSVSDDNSFVSATLSTQISMAGNGIFTIPDYLTSAPYTPGTGADDETGNAATNIVAALVTATIKQKNLEINPTKNPNSLFYLNYTISSLDAVNEIVNAVFTASYNCPVILTTNPNGSRSISAREYLL
jgi:hypothetical protein